MLTDVNLTDFKDFENVANSLCIEIKLCENVPIRIKATNHDACIIYKCMSWFFETYHYYLSVKTFKKLCENPQFNSHFKHVKQNRLRNIEIPYDENTFDTFIYSKQTNLEYYYCDSFILSKLENVNKNYNMCECAMHYDDEFAYTHLFRLTKFQQFSPFIAFKKNYEKRKERLLMVYEETYSNYSECGNAIESAFSNEYVIMVISRFL